MSDHSPIDAPADSATSPPVDPPVDPRNIPYEAPASKYDPNLTIWGEPRDESYWRMMKLVRALAARDAELGLVQGWWPDPEEEAEWDPVEEAIQQQEVGTWVAAQKEAQSGDASSSDFLPFVPYQNPPSSQPGIPTAPKSPAPAKSELGEGLGRHVERQLSLDDSLPAVAQAEDHSPQPQGGANSKSILQPPMKDITPDASDLQSSDSQLQSQEKAQGKQKDTSQLLSSLATPIAVAKSEPAAELEPAGKPALNP